MSLLRWLRDNPWILVLAAVQLTLHLSTNGRYGIFRDELYYLACADHIAWGYVDHPPLSIAVLAGWKSVVGDSVWAVRLLPALIGVALILLSARITEELGGGAFSRVLAAIATLIAPVYLANTGFYSMNAIDILAWTVALWGIVHLTNTRDPRFWWVLGIVFGLGLLNKLSVAVLGLGFVAAIALTPLREDLRKKEPWIAAGIVILFILPHIIWQVQNDWPTREFIENAQRYKIAETDPIEFLLAVMLETHPANALLWLAGFVGLFALADLRKHRALAIVFLVALGVFLMRNSKPYYLSPAFPGLFAAGAIVFERALGIGKRRWLRGPILATQLIAGAIIAPLAIPILAPEALVRHQERIGITPPNAERSEAAPFSQHLADRFGWEELTAAVAEVYETLSESERLDCAIICDNYGEAGALCYFAEHFGIPKAGTQHNSFYFWGPGDASGELMITVGLDPEELRESFESVELVARGPVHPFSMPYERNLPICICRGLEAPLPEVWEAGRAFI